MIKRTVGEPIEMEDFISSCPNCGAKSELASGIDVKPGRSPAVGDLSVCIQCAAILVFGEKLKLRHISQEELATLSRNERTTLQQVVAAIVVTKEHRKP